MKVKKLHPGWIVFIGCTVLAFTVVGLCNNTRTLYLEPVSMGLGVSRTLLSVVLMTSGLLSALCSMFMGPLRRRLTLRQMAILGCAMMVVSNLLYGLSSTLWLYFLGEVCCGFGMGFSSMAVLALLLRAWFSKYYGTLQGCVSMATGLGSILFAPVVGNLIVDLGYNNAYLVTAGIMFLTLLVAVFFIHDSPEEKGLEPLFSERKASAPASDAPVSDQWEGLTLREAMHTRQFYLMCLLGFLMGSGIMAVQGTYGAYIGTDMGYGTVFASSVVSFLYLFNMIFKIPLGVMIDRIGVRVVVLVCSVGMIGAAAALVVLGNGGGAVTAFVFGAFMGVGNIAFTVPAPLVAPTIFGTKNVTATTGVFMAFFSLGSAFGPPIANLFYQNTGSYIPMYLTTCIQFLVVIVIAALIIKPARKKADDATFSTM